MSWFFSKIRDVFSRTKEDANLHTELERILYDADLGTELVANIMSDLDRAKGIDDLRSMLESKLVEYISPYQGSLKLNEGLNVILLVGVNGVGKTTAAAKLGNLIKRTYNKKIMFAGADTFRAAGVDQLEQWSKKVGTEFFSKGSGSDPSAVAYESINEAKQKGVDVLIIDTGGRLHTQVGLMSEISKMQKAVSKSLGRSPDHVILVIDSTQGQNIKNQAELFSKSLDLSGTILTKFDGTAKGGALFGAIGLLRKPVFFVCNGEKLENISEFNAHSFVHKIL